MLSSYAFIAKSLPKEVAYFLSFLEPVVIDQASFA